MKIPSSKCTLKKCHASCKILLKKVLRKMPPIKDAHLEKCLLQNAPRKIPPVMDKIPQEKNPLGKKMPAWKNFFKIDYGKLPPTKMPPPEKWLILKNAL